MVMNLETLQAIAEPNRFHIIELLREGPLTVGEIAEQLELHQPQASKHLRVLSDTGLVSVHPDANRRIYSLQPQRFLEFEEWVQSYVSIWENRLGRLDHYLREMQGNAGMTNTNNLESTKGE